jgi:hypothetical protein
VEAHHQHLQPRRDLARFFQYAGIDNVQQAKEGYCSSAELAYNRQLSKSSADGLTHIYHEHAVVSQIRAVLSFSKAARTVELSWLDDLPPADTTTLHCTGMSCIFPTTPRVLVAELFEQQDRHAEAIRFAQTDLQDYHNLNVPAKVRAGRVLGRCHAALGQHMLSVSAFDAAIDLARSRKLLLSEALSVQGQAAAGKIWAGDSGLHCDEETGRQRLAESDGADAGAARGAREGLGTALRGGLKQKRGGCPANKPIRLTEALQARRFFRVGQQQCDFRGPSSAASDAKTSGFRGQQQRGSRRKQQRGFRGQHSAASSASKIIFQATIGRRRVKGIARNHGPLFDGTRHV